LEKTILKVEESKNAAKLEKHLQICRQHSAALK